MIPKIHFLILSCALTVAFFGCQTLPSKNESSEEIIRAVGSMTGALAGKEMSDQEARHLVQNLQKDKEARSAIESISGALDIKQTGIKYCPTDGKRFNSDVINCPEHKVKLTELVD